MARAKRARRYGPGESLPGKVPLPRAEDEGGTYVELLRLKAQISDAEEELGEWRLRNLRVSNWATWTKAFDERRGR